ncbi:MAG: ribonuclease T [Sphingobium sp.]
MPRAGRRVGGVAAAVLLATPVAALAQAFHCSPPRQVARPQVEAPTKADPRRVLPVGAYTLALTWSPQHCSTARGARHALQCGRAVRFGFTLHGLWPDGVGAEWPQYCRPASLLSPAEIRKNLCMTPSVQLLQHEWAKHGTCMATRPELYFDLARAFYRSIRYPDMAALARQPNLTVDAFTRAFARANRALKPEMIRVRTTRGNWLAEVWLCMDRQMEFARCPARKTGAAAASILRIEPGPGRPVTSSSAVRRKPSESAGTRARSPVRPARTPGLVLDLDPNVQPLTNSAAP